MAEEHFVEPAPASPAGNAGEASERASDSDRDRVVSVLRDHCAVAGSLLTSSRNERGQPWSHAHEGSRCRPRRPADLLVAVSPSTSATRSAVDRGSDGRVGVQGPVEAREHTSVVAVMASATSI